MSRVEWKACARRRSRRDFLLLLGGTAFSLPLLSMTGCTPEEAEPPPTSEPDPRDQNTDDPVPPGQSASELGQRPEQVGGPDRGTEDSGELPRLEESDSMAQALGYKHDASRVDSGQFPSRAGPDSADEFCRNCVHYQAAADVQWAPCTIFPGKLVNADGWCSAWAATA